MHCALPSKKISERLPTRSSIRAPPSIASLKSASNMLRTVGNRFTSKVSLNKLVPSKRRFSSTPPTKLQSTILTSERKPADGGVNSVIAILGIALVFGLPVIYIKTEKIQLDAQVENVIGTLLGTSAVLFLRPDTAAKDSIDLTLDRVAGDATGSFGNSISSEEQSGTSSSLANEIGGQSAHGGDSSASSTDRSSGSAVNIIGAVGAGVDSSDKLGENAEDLVCPFPPKKAQDAAVATAGEGDASSLVCPLPQESSASSSATASGVDAKEDSSSHSKEHSSGAATSVVSSSGITDAVCPIPQNNSAGGGAGSSSDPAIQSKSGTHLFHHLFWTENYFDIGTYTTIERSVSTVNA